MATIPELKQIKKRTYWSYHQDGLIDLCLGLVFLLLGIQRLTGNSVIAGFFWMPFLLIDPLKRLITAPRTGMVRFSRSRNVSAFLIGFLASAVAVVLFIAAASRLGSPGLDAWKHRYFEIIFGSAWALFFLVCAIRLGVRRFYAYMVLFTAGFSFFLYRHENPTDVFIAIGSIMILVGGAVLIRFLHDHPLPGKEKCT
jgi:hypothetical protein